MKIMQICVRMVISEKLMIIVMTSRIDVLVKSDQADDVTDYSDRRQTLVMMIKFVIFLGSTSFAFAQSLLNLNRLRNGACC